MNLYEELMEECVENNIEVYIRRMKNKGLYSDNIIWLSNSLSTTVEKISILAEELGHYYTTAGDILNQSKIDNRKQELRARAWAHNRVFPLTKIIEAHQLNLRNKYELADYFNVTESFIEASLKRYQDKYGLYVDYGKYTIFFDPLEVIEHVDYKKFYS
ncbi:ImmA/IrrE family metallo-endopeptidase [Oceanobacillus oncorhynchi]|uniref:ImmA/IrrE family metallo-endopeptidase n=1 Tax=Oceanobacillus oncorhynchi TaxID=545501 RepID=UPI0034D43E4A